MRRFRFQFHLSTAIVMMLVAGALLGLNLRRWPHEEEGLSRIAYIEADMFDSGWPFVAYEHCDFKGKLLGVMGGDVWDEWQYAGLMGDALLALAIIVAAGVLCEWLIRRRSRTPH
jgi:hypothetical protein